jgi:hypothetical protein
MLFQLLKNASKWVFKKIEDSGKAMNDAEDRMVAAMFNKKDKDDSN